jgi:hypothetical protein
MSSRLVKKFKRTYNIASTTWATGTLTVNTSGVHYLNAGDKVTILFNNVPQNLTGTVINGGTFGSSTQFTIACPNDYQIGADGQVIVEFFSSGLAVTTINGGVLPPIAIANSSYGDTVVQGVLATSGSATIVIQGSLDGVNFVNTGATVTISASTTAFATITAAWPYLRPVVTANATSNLTLLVTA